MNTFGGMKVLWIFFLGHHKIGLYLWVISMYLGSLFKVKVQNGGYFLAAKISFFFFLGGGGGCLKFLRFILGEM